MFFLGLKRWPVPKAQAAQAAQAQRQHAEGDEAALWGQTQVQPLVLVIVEDGETYKPRFVDVAETGAPVYDGNYGYIWIWIRSNEIKLDKVRCIPSGKLT